MKRFQNKYAWWFALVLVLIIVGGCKAKRPSGILSESKMENLLYDYHVAKVMGDDLPSNENYKKQYYIDYVFRKHGVTEAIFDSSMVWYARHTDVLAQVYVQVSKRLKSHQEEIARLVAFRDRKLKTSDPGDSIDVWREDRVYFLTGYPLNNKVLFVLPSDENFKKQDSLSWEVRYRFFDSQPADSAMKALMSMQIVYKNDSIVSAIKEIRKSGKEYIGLQSDTSDIKEIRGFIYFSQRDTLKRNLLIDNVALMRYHAGTDTILDAQNLKKQ
ncbi:MAG: DUF4296 domain-containing protein [Mediterranea sp.]|jgi:hypothetical protein|nr:DUF4296 domain-containing protein [Mediterranea sp.]